MLSEDLIKLWADQQQFNKSDEEAQIEAQAEDKKLVQSTL